MLTLLPSPPPFKSHIKSDTALPLLTLIDPRLCIPYTAFTEHEELHNRNKSAGIHKAQKLTASIDDYFADKKFGVAYLTHEVFGQVLVFLPFSLPAQKKLICLIFNVMKQHTILPKPPIPDWRTRETSSNHGARHGGPGEHDSVVY